MAIALYKNKNDLLFVLLLHFKMDKAHAVTQDFVASLGISLLTSRKSYCPSTARASQMLSCASNKWVTRRLVYVSVSHVDATTSTAALVLFCPLVSFHVVLWLFVFLSVFWLLSFGIFVLVFCLFVLFWSHYLVDMFRCFVFFSPCVFSSCVRACVRACVRVCVCVCVPCCVFCLDVLLVFCLFLCES